jgi:hypothetical protein
VIDIALELAEFVDIGVRAPDHPFALHVGQGGREFLAHDFLLFPNWVGSMHRRELTTPAWRSIHTTSAIVRAARAVPIASAVLCCAKDISASGPFGRWLTG